MEIFENVKVDLDISKRKVGYGDYRDWFILDSRQVHETELHLFINSQQIHTSLFAINTKQIICKVSAEVNKDVYVESMRWDVPEMGISRTTTFHNAMFVHIDDKLTIDLTIKINAEEGE
jgi:hypothetical protein